MEPKRIIVVVGTRRTPVAPVIARTVDQASVLAMPVDSLTSLLAELLQQQMELYQGAPTLLTIPAKPVFTGSRGMVNAPPEPGKAWSPDQRRHPGIRRSGHRG